MSKKLGLFEAYGVELEYMIVANGSLNVLPICDRLIEAECGRIESEIERGSIAWSNELVLHVVELKTAAPSPTLLGLHQQFRCASSCHLVAVAPVIAAPGHEAAAQEPNLG